MKKLTFLIIFLLSCIELTAQSAEENTSKWQVMMNFNLSYAVEEVKEDKLSNPGIGFQFNRLTNKPFGFQSRIGYTRWNANDIWESLTFVIGANYRISQIGKYQLNGFLNTGVMGFTGGDSYASANSVSELGLHVFPIEKGGLNMGLNFTFFPIFFNSVNVFVGYKF